MRLAPFSKSANGLAGAAAGTALWTLAEYVTHRWVLHGPFGQGRLTRLPLGRIHRNHHADPDHTVLIARAGGCTAVAAATGLVTHLATRVVPKVFATAAGATFAGGYVAYDAIHWRAHHRPPRTAYGRRLRQRHFRHHFGAPRANLGVTMTCWDTVFGTEADDRPVTVPARFAPPWLDQLGPGFARG